MILLFFLIPIQFPIQLYKKIAALSCPIFIIRTLNFRDSIFRSFKADGTFSFCPKWKILTISLHYAQRIKYDRNVRKHYKSKLGIFVPSQSFFCMYVLYNLSIILPNHQDRVLWLCMKDIFLVFITNRPSQAKASALAAQTNFYSWLPDIFYN